MKFGPAELAQLMDEAKTFITVSMVFSVYIGIVLGVTVAVCAAVLRRRSHRDRAEPRLTNKELLTPESSPALNDPPAREYTSIRNDIIPDGRIPGFDEPIFSFRLIILLLILALGGGGIFYWHYASYRLDTPQRSNDSHRSDTAQRPDSLQRPLPPRIAYMEVYSMLGISPLPEAGENASIRRALEQLNRERCDKQAIFDLARAMQTGGYRREAAQVDVAFSRMCGGHAPSLRRAVNVLLALSDYVEAAAVASDLIDLEPLYDNGYYLRALARDGSGLAEKALDDYITAVELVGNKDRIFSRSYFNMARLYEKLGRFCDAVLPIEAWVALNPKYDTSQTRTIIANYMTKGRCATETRGSAEVFSVARPNDTVNLPVTINGVRGALVLEPIQEVVESDESDVIPLGA